MARISFKKGDVELELELETDDIRDARANFTKIIDNFAETSAQTHYKPLNTDVDEKDLKRLYFIGFFAGVYAGIVIVYLQKYLLESLSLGSACGFVLFCVLAYFIGFYLLIFIKRFINKGNWL